MTPPWYRALDKPTCSHMPLKPHTSTPRPHISHPAQDADLLLPSWYRDLAEACWSADPSQRPSVSKILEGLAAQVSHEVEPLEL